MSTLREVCGGLPLNPLPAPRVRDEATPHAPVLRPNLTPGERRLALENALRYFPPEHHAKLAPEFHEELRSYGHIYMYRFRPDIEMRAYPLNEYPARCRQAAAIMHMIMNNLDPRVAQFPHELVTYGGNGQVLSNWAQFWLVMNYLSEMSEEQTLVMYSGHPLGVFPSSPASPRLIITNGMVVPNYSSREDYDRMFALGVTMYGQMTAGSYCYIGPQGIVHGTTLTVLNAGRKYLGLEDLSGKVFLTSGLGGMSGAQAKAAVICGCVGVVAEVSEEALVKRHKQGWVMEKTADMDELVAMIRAARRDRRATSIGYHGNIVHVWERMLEEYRKTGELLVELGSDQTSCHNPFLGGYYPVQLSYDEARDMMTSDPVKFKSLVQESLCRQIAAINELSQHAMFFWDYGNAFLLEASRAGADVLKKGDTTGNQFRYPSYVQHIMGDIFSLGFGPFRWVCTSADPADLQTTDEIACATLEELQKKGVPGFVKQQYNDNMRWIREAGRHKMVVGSQARILYSDQKGRIAISLNFNQAVADGRLKAPVVLSRDHHDVSGTDSPFRETSNIYDGSTYCADMAIQNVIGDSFRGATWVAIGTYAPADLLPCAPCSRCGDGLFELYPCTFTSDVFCEKCSSYKRKTGVDYENKCSGRNIEKYTMAGEDEMAGDQPRAEWGVGPNPARDEPKHSSHAKDKAVDDGDDDNGDNSDGKNFDDVENVTKEVGGGGETNNADSAKEENPSSSPQLKTMEPSTEAGGGVAVGSIFIAIFGCGFVFFLLGFFFTRLIYKPANTKSVYITPQDDGDVVDAHEMTYMSRDHTFDYEDCTTPMLRHHSDGGCLYQSPIDIRPDEAALDERLQKHPLLLQYVDGDVHAIANTGTTVKIDADVYGSVVTGGPLGNTKYQLDHIHFHWGSTDVQGSEHSVNNTSYAGEIHLVHWNKEDYSSFSEAVHSEDGLTVLAALLSVSGVTDNPDLASITDGLPHIRYKGQTYDMPNPCQPVRLLPGNTNEYWTYMGSLTAYSETVIWVVFKNPLIISPRQMAAFRSLASTVSPDGQESDDIYQLADNFRPTQPLNGRVIKASFL